MTDKELQKLGRGDLLKLLLEQVNTVEQTGRELEDLRERAEDLEETYERLRERLNQKDARIHELQEAIQELEPLRERAKEADRLEAELESSKERVRELNEVYERLRERLDQKDEKIRTLRDTLQAERENRNLDLAEVGSIAEAALKLNGVFEAAQRAADQYLRSIRAANPAPEPPQGDGKDGTRANDGSDTAADSGT